MLSLPDLQHKKIVFISSFRGDANDLKFHNSNIRLYKYDKFVNQISCHLVSSIFIIGETTITTKLIKKLKDYGISVFLLNASFQNYAEIMSIAEGNYVLRAKQYKASMSEELKLAKILVTNKIKNQYNLLKNLKRKPELKLLKQTLKSIEGAENRNSLLGLEGNYSKYYFEKAFADIGWYRRAPRTKEDINNLLLDIGYTFMFNYIDSLLRLFGFDTYKGFYHQLFFQRKSLSCDILEPFRVLVDKQLVKSYNLKQIDEKDFRFKNGAFSFKKYDLQKKYTSIWFDLIMDHKEEIYSYIQDFYRFIINPSKYPNPEYKFNDTNLLRHNFG